MDGLLKKPHEVKQGDVYRVPTSERSGCSNFEGHSASVYVRVTSAGVSSHHYEILDTNLMVLGTCSGCFSRNFPYYPRNSQTFMSSLGEKFALAFKSEPEKSFIKAGVMNTDGSLTGEGQEVFIAWLLKQNGSDFKKEVVDPILAEEAKDKS